MRGKKSRFADEIGERYEKTEYRVEKVHNDGVVH